MKNGFLFFVSFIGKLQVCSMCNVCFLSIFNDLDMCRYSQQQKIKKKDFAKQNNKRSHWMRFIRHNKSDCWCMKRLMLFHSFFFFFINSRLCFVIWFLNCVFLLYTLTASFKFVNRVQTYLHTTTLKTKSKKIRYVDSEQFWWMAFLTLINMSAMWNIWNEWNQMKQKQIPNVFSQRSMKFKSSLFHINRDKLQNWIYVDKSKMPLINLNRNGFQ